MAKDDAERRAAKLVRVVEAGEDFRLYFGTYWDESGTKSSMEILAAELRQVVADAIREAVADAERVAALAMRDMQVDSEAFHAGWEECRRRSIFWIGRMQDDGTIDMLCGDHVSATLKHMDAPSHDAEGEPVPPSRLRQKVERLEKALRQIAEVSSQGETPYAVNWRQDCEEVNEIARKALKEESDECG